MGDTDRLHVALTTEGTYPHFRGGVSTWCDHLIRGNPDVDFTVWALMMNPFIGQEYPFPPNVERFVGLPLWGAEQPVEYTQHAGATKPLTLAPLTSERRVREHFVPLLRELMLLMSAEPFDPARFGELLYVMHLWFQKHDYRTTFRTRAVWQGFKDALVEINLLDPIDDDDSEWDPDLHAETRVHRFESRNLAALMRARRATAPSEIVGTLPSVDDAVEGMRWLSRLLLPLEVPILQADVVHSSAAAFCGIPGILAKIDRGTPLLVTEHGVYIREQYLAIGRYGYPYFLKKFVVTMINAVARTCFYYADQVSPVCEYNARWERRNGADDRKIKVIYNGVNDEVFAPVTGRSAEPPTVVTLARIDPLKDLTTFVRVADLVHKEIPEVRFIQWGPVSDPDSDREVRGLVKSLGLERTVEFRGSTTRAPEAWNQGDVALLTSKSEAFPYAVIEALMCGLPVVSTNVGGVAEALADLGHLAPIGDADRLAEGVIRMLRMSPADRRDLGDRCRQRAVSHFRLETAVGSYGASYRDLAARRDTPLRRPEAAHVLRSDGTAPLDVDYATDLDIDAAAIDDLFRGSPIEIAAALPTLAHDPRPAARQRAALALLDAALPLHERRSLIAAELAVDPHPGVRAAAVRVLGRLMTESEGVA